jgi:pyruvate dehydrogenase E1 component alpha subunit
MREKIMENKEYLELFHQMVLIRRIEESAAELYQQGKIGGFLHLYIGQEAVSTGLIAARKPQDRVITAYRDHGVAINCGIPARQVLAELLGKATGISKGKGGSMHMADTSRNFWGGHAIVGAHLPIAAGLALGDQYKKTDGVTICMFGDGASNIGFFHEALNLSKVWKLPVLWVCENNQYGMGTSIDRASAVSEIVQKACGYGMKADQENGMDVLAVYEKAKEMIEKVRGGEGPMFLEYMTYRFRGHSMGDPERYRKSEEVHRWELDDPIGIYYNVLIKKKISNDAGLKKIEKAAEDEVADAVKFAEESPEPAAEELFSNIYA